jgi:hypothetical protein
VRKEILRYLVIGVVLAGAFVALAAPNVYTAMQRSKQKRTYAALVGWGTVIDAYGTANGSYPRAGYYGPVSGITPLLSQKLPVVDGWGHPIIYHGSKNHYALRSTARDGVNDHRVDRGLTKELDDDVLYADGRFVRVMEGICGGSDGFDDWDVKKYGECASCHPAHVRHS